MNSLQTPSNTISRERTNSGHATCSSTRRDRVLVRFIGHLYDLTIWPKKATIQSLCRRHQVSRRTLLRDFAKLRENGIPVKFDSQGGYYHLANSFLNPSEFEEAPASLDNKNDQITISVQPEWPLGWNETVAFFAILEGAKPPAGSELQTLVRRARERLTDWVEIALRDKAGSVFSNAKLLVKEPSLSISELHGVMEKFWSRKGKTRTNGSGRSGIHLETPIPAPFEVYSDHRMTKNA